MKNGFHSDREIIDKKLIQGFIPDVTHFFTYLLQYDNDCVSPLIPHLLKTRKPDIRIAENRWFYNDPDIRAKIEYIADRPHSSSQKNDDRIRMTLLQALIRRINSQKDLTSSLPLIKELIAYDRRCLTQRDSRGNDIIDYLNQLRERVNKIVKAYKPELHQLFYLFNDNPEFRFAHNLDKSIFTASTMAAFNNMSVFIENELKKELCFQQVGTFFAGSKKFNEKSDSMVFQLPENVVEKIAVMTMKSGF